MSEKKSMGGVEVRLFMSNCPYRCTERDIERFIEPVGEVLSVTFPRERESQLRKGYVFATVRLKPDIPEDAAWSMLDGNYMAHPGSLGTQRKITVRKATRRGEQAEDEADPVA